LTSKLRRCFSADLFCKDLRASALCDKRLRRDLSYDDVKELYNRTTRDILDSRVSFQTTMCRRILGSTTNAVGRRDRSARPSVRPAATDRYRMLTGQLWHHGAYSVGTILTCCRRSGRISGWTASALTSNNHGVSGGRSTSSWVVHESRLWISARPFRISSLLTRLLESASPHQLQTHRVSSRLHRTVNFGSSGWSHQWTKAGEAAVRQPMHLSLDSHPTAESQRRRPGTLPLPYFQLIASARDCPIELQAGICHASAEKGGHRPR
jgi:hypothetical protein